MSQSPPARTPRRRQTRPNILILMDDQHRADCLSCAGHPIVRTPNLDRLASQGLRFDCAYSCSPVCMPARSSFLTGLFPHNHGQWNNYGRTPPDAPSYARILADSGYHTCHIGKSHFYVHRDGEHLNQYLPFMQQLGWQQVMETTGPYATQRTESILTDHWQQIGCLETFRDDYRRRRNAGSAKATWPSPLPPGQTMDDFVGDLAERFIDSYTRPDPLLLFVGFGGPHDPWDPPADWAEQYDPDQMDPPQPITRPDSWVPRHAAAHQRKLQRNTINFTASDARRIRALYYAKVSHVDHRIGRILDVLERRGMLDNTAILYWSDHGEMLCDKGRIHKTVFYESAARVPMIVRPPGGMRGRVTRKLASMIDGFPTILDWAEIEGGFRGFGRSLLPQLRSPRAAGHLAVFGEVGDRTMIRTDRWKFVVRADGQPLKLYDMQADPQEQTNLLGKPRTARLVEALRQQMLDWHLATQHRQG